MTTYSIKRFSMINKSDSIIYTDNEIKEKLPRLYWELKKVSDKMKSHPFNKIRMRLLEDSDYPILYIPSIEDILFSLTKYRNGRSDDEIVGISNNDRPIYFDFKENKWILYDKRSKKNRWSDDKGIKYYILSEWSKLIDSWRNEYSNEWIDNETDKKLFFDYLDKLYKEVEKIKV